MTNTKLRLRPVFKLEYARELIRQGHVCHKVVAHDTDPDMLVFFFDKTKEVNDIIVSLHK